QFGEAVGVQPGPVLVAEQPAECGDAHTDQGLRIERGTDLVHGRTDRVEHAVDVHRAVVTSLTPRDGLAVAVENTDLGAVPVDSCGDGAQFVQVQRETSRPASLTRSGRDLLSEDAEPGNLLDDAGHGRAGDSELASEIGTRNWP